MPPIKKQKTSANTTKDVPDQTEEKTPEQKFTERLKSAIHKISAEGYMPIRTIPPEDNDDDEEEGKGDKPKRVYTEEDMSTLRFILITKNRAKTLKASAKFVTCGQQDDGVMMFNTHDGNVVIEGIPKEVSKAMKKKTLAEKFDALFALTFMLNRYDCWLYDNEFGDEYGEGELNDAIKRLSKAWIELFSKSNEALNIDEEFTRPGIEALLTDFAEKLTGYPYLQAKLTWK